MTCAWYKLEDDNDDYDDNEKTKANCGGVLVMMMPDEDLHKE